MNQSSREMKGQQGDATAMRGLDPPSLGPKMKKGNKGLRILAISKKLKNSFNLQPARKWGPKPHTSKVLNSQYQQIFRGLSPRPFEKHQPATT